MELLVLSFKNVLNARKRSFLTFLILIFGVFVYCYTTLLLDALLYLSMQESIKQETAHIRIQKKDYDEDFPFSSNNWISWTNITELSSFNVTPRLFVEADIDNYENSLPVPLVGIDPETDFEVFDVPRSLSNATLAPGKVWLGKILAQDLNVQEGDFVNLTFQTKEGTFISAEYELEAFLTSSLTTISDNGVYVNLSDLQNLLKSDSITSVYFKLNSLKNLSNMQSSLQQQYPDLRVESYHEILAEVQDSLSQRKQIFSVYLILILIITFLGITNSILISVWEKKRLIGTLRALGQPDKNILLLFLFEGAWIAFLGSLGGVLLAIVVNIPLSTIGIDMLSMMKMGKTTISSGIAIPSIVRTSWNITPFILPLVVIPILSSLASLFPAYKSIQMSIIDSIKNND